MSRREPAASNNSILNHVIAGNLNKININRTDTDADNVKSNLKQKSELDAINMQNGLDGIHRSCGRELKPTKTGEDNLENMDGYGNMDGDGNIDEKPSKKVSALISQFNSIVHTGVSSQPKSSSFRAAPRVTKLGPSGKEVNVTRSQSLSCKMSVVTSGDKFEDVARGKKTRLQTTSEETHISLVELSGRNGVINTMKNSHVVPNDIKMPASLVSAEIKTSERDNRISSQSTNDQLLTTSSTIRNSNPISNVRLGKPLDIVSEKSNTLPNKTSFDNKTNDTRANVRVGSVWSTASIFDTIAKSEEKSKLNIQIQNDKPAVKPRTNTAWSKLRHSLGHNFSSKSLPSQTETTQSKDFGLDLAVKTQISKSDAENSFESERKTVAKSIDASGDRVHAPRSIDKKSKMESNLSIRGSISPSVVISPEIPRYRKTSLKSIAQITDSMEQIFRKSQELSSPPPTSSNGKSQELSSPLPTSGNEFQENVSAANVICDSTPAKSSSGFTQFKEHIPTDVGHVHKVIAVNDFKNSSSLNPDEGKYTKMSTSNENSPDNKVQSSKTSGDVRQFHEKEVKHAARMADIATKFGNEYGTPKQQTPKSLYKSDSSESLVKRENSPCTKTEAGSHALIFNVLDVQNTKVDYCNATDRINNALNKLKTELMSMRQMDLLLLKQLINISQTIQKIQKSRVLRVSKSLSFSSSYLHPKPLQSQTRFHSSTLERQNSAPFTMERKRLMYRDMRSSTESSLSSFDESEFDSQSEMEESTTSLTSIYPYLSPKAIRARAMSQSRVSDASLFRDVTEDPDKTYEDILKRNVRLWKLGVERQTSVIEEMTCLL